jgi:transposase InsO family protein
MGEVILGLLDSGASCSVLGTNANKLLQRIGLEVFEKKVQISTADGTKHIVTGYVNMPYEYNDRVRVIPTLIVPSLTQELILGVDFWRAFNIVPTIIETETVNLLVSENLREPGENPMQEAEEADAETSHRLTTEEHTRMNIIKKRLEKLSQVQSPTHVMTHYIDTGDARPIASQPYMYSPKVENQIHEEIERMLSLGVIEKSKSSWRHPIVVVPKKDTGKVRLCLDSRKLNAVTVPDAYPIPNLNRILGRLRNTKFLSTIDLKDAFWAIPLEESSKQKTAFVVPGKGLYQFRVLPFGLNCAAQALARLMDIVLGIDLEPHVFMYLDDIVICGETAMENMALLEVVTSRLEKAGLRVNLEKSHFCRKQITYLGYTLSENGLSINSEKVTPILDFPIPRNKRAVRRFLGMSGWYQRFIEDFSTIVAPITDLLSAKGEKIEWNQKADEAFHTIKGKLVQAPCLANADYTKQFSIHADASDRGCGGVLSQQHENGEKPVAFFSHKFSSAQRNYSTTEKECLAVVLSVEKFRPYVDGVRFTIITDHSSLLWLLNYKTPTSSRLARWVIRLQPYQFEIIHRKGKDHIVPDALSRIVETLHQPQAVTISAVKQVENNPTKTSSEVDKWYEGLWKLIHESPDNYPEYKIEGNDLLKHCRVPNDLGDHDFTWKLVVSKAGRGKVIHENHDQTAHFGVYKTIRRIRQRFYWPGMHYDVERYINCCEICKASKIRRTNQEPPMGNQKVSSEPWQIISMDFVGKFPRSSHRNTQLLVIYDWYSKYAITKPMTAALAGKLCDFLEYEVFLLFGVPQFIISDNGSQFVSHQFNQLMQKYGVTHWPNARYHSQHNPAERVNGVLEDAIRCYLGEDQRHWDRHLKQITYALNTSISSVTQLTPHFINFGKELKIHGSEYPTKDHIDDPKDFANDKMEELARARDYIKERLTRSYETTKKRYNLRKRLREYKVGDVVWRKNFTLSDASKNYAAKLGKKYVKCKILKRIGTSCYELGDIQGRSLGVFSSKDFFC